MSTLLYDEQEYTRIAYSEVLNIFNIKHISTSKEEDAIEILRYNDIKKVILIKKNKEFLNGFDVEKLELHTPTADELANV